MTATFDFWLDSLGEPSKWGKQGEGNRDAHWPCPMGGGDPGSTSMHVTEKTGADALVKDFAHDHSKAELVEYVAGQKDEWNGSALLARPKPSNGGVGKDSSVPAGNSSLGKPARGVRLPAASTNIKDPLAWYAEYCGVDLQWMRAEIPVRATKDGWIAHYWDSTAVTKERQAGSGERRWTPKGSLGPRLWPEAAEMPEEIWLAEGESDVVVLRSLGLPAFTAGSASQPPTLHEFRSMMSRGVERVVVAYDADKSGREASDKATETAREAGLGVTLAVLADPLFGGPKDWRERHQADQTVPETEAADWTSQVWSMDEVAEAETLDLLIGRLDPHDHTILFGDGGVGKGVVAAYWVAQLAKKGLKVLILDYEAHATTEWKKRLATFLSKDGHRQKQIHIVQPDVPIWEFAATAREMVLGLGIDYVVVDSALYACSGADPYSPEGATQYSLAIVQMKRPVLTLAHVTKSKENRDKPFGSIFWHNGARLTISIEAKGRDDPREVMTRKESHGGSFAVSIPWDWVNTALPPKLDEQPLARGVDDKILIALAQGSATLLELYARIGDEKKGTVSITIGRMKSEGLVTSDGGHPAVYDLAGP